TYWPIDLETTLVENHYIGHAPETPETAPIWNEIIDTFHRVLYQDYQFCEGAQKSVKSSGCKGLLLGCLERSIYHMHETFDQVIGPENISANLRVNPVLGEFVQKR
ncbi:MAG: SRPBCC family protein, partial [Caulobacterales bacterium]